MFDRKSQFVRKVFKRRKKIKEIQKKRERILKEESWWDFVKKFKLDDNLTNDKENGFIVTRNYLTKIETFSQNIYTELIKVILMLKLGNISAAEEIIYEQVQKDPKRIIFEVNVNDKKEIKENFSKVILPLFDFLVSSNIDEKLIKIYITYWENFLNFSGMEMLKQRYKVKWSLNEVREIIESPYWGLSLPFVWHPILYRRTTSDEANRYILAALDYSTMSKMNLDVLYFIKHNFPGDKKIRSRVVHLLKKLSESNSLYEKSLLLDLISSEPIRQEVIKVNDHYKKPVFSIKRSFYRELINKSVAIDYAILNLFSLGDLDMNLLWWKGIEYL